MDEGSLNTGGAAWGDWLRGVAGSVIDKATEARYVRPYDMQAMEMEQYGPGGYYREGRAGTYQRAPATIGGMAPTTMLLIGGAVLAAVLLLRR